MNHFQGLIAASLTPFKKNGSINPQVIADYAAYLKQNNVDGVFVNGTTGESFSLTFEERQILAAAWCRQQAADFKVIIHVGATSHPESTQLATHAQNCGANAIAEMGPIFFKPANIKELVSYCSQTSAAAPELPYGS